jgi:hypothetical protein
MFARRQSVVQKVFEGYCSDNAAYGIGWIGTQHPGSGAVEQRKVAEG